MIISSYNDEQHLIGMIKYFGIKNCLLNLPIDGSPSISDLMFIVSYIKFCQKYFSCPKSEFMIIVFKKLC